MDNVTAAQAAALTGFSERTIRRKIASGELPARRLAPNRFAIDVRDLPVRWDDKDLARRMDMLEHRVRVLEERQRTLLRYAGASGREQAAGESAGQPEDSISTLHDLLIELAQETERLSPLFAHAEPSKPRTTRASGARQRGMRGSHRDDTARTRHA